MPAPRPDELSRLEVSTGLIYKWRHEALAGEPRAAFVPAILASDRAVAAAPANTTAITVEFGSGARVTIGAQAFAMLVT
jgi:hypothetical protein